MNISFPGMADNAGTKLADCHPNCTVNISRRANDVPLLLAAASFSSGISLAEFRPQGRKNFLFIFRAGVYEAKNTNRFASVEFRREQRRNYARRPHMFTWGLPTPLPLGVGCKAAMPNALAGASHSKCSKRAFGMTEFPERYRCRIAHV